MAFPHFDSLSETDKLKLTVLCDVKKICNEVGSGLSQRVSFEKQAVELIAEMVWRKVQDYGTDLELFARHAKHTTINADDVRLLVRKNECLKDRIKRISEDLNSASSSKKRKKDKELDIDLEAGSSNSGTDNNLIGNFDMMDDLLDD
ncbi:Centromere protein S [Frankliniella fusca]|uniref:Centromere protein S n=1 Tax=Frankliniella fusca TaxID=407009 RepID=A0AAE1HZA1_9NEOP|nr:Centromere protein S [Frankliniella fusca]